MKYQRKSVAVEAFQLTKERRRDNSEWPNWLNAAWKKDGGEGAMCISILVKPFPTPNYLALGTKEGVVLIYEGDWIIRDPDGTLSACKPDVFAAAYEEFSV